MGLLAQGWAMPIGQMQQTISQNDDITQMQRSLNQQFGQIGQVPFMNGNSLGSVTISGTTVVNHGLGRQAQGYFVTANNAFFVIYNAPFSGTTSITFYCSGTSTVNLWVY